MECVKPSAVNPRKKLARDFTEVLRLRALIGIAQVDGLNNADESVKDEGNMDITTINWTLHTNDEALHEKIAEEALIAKLFASTSTVKAAYAQLQFSQSPYDPDGIEAADQVMVSELMHLSELKRCYLKLKKQFDPSPNLTILAAESKELRSVVKSYEITGKKLELQARLKESEVMFLRKKLEEAIRQNKSIEKKLNEIGQLSLLDNLHISGLSHSHFNTVLRRAIRSIRRFVRLIVDQMRCASWDIEAAVDAIEHDVLYLIEDHKCYAIESFVCKEMFDSFHFANFSLPNECLPDKNKQRQWFFRRFNELKSTKANEFLAEEPTSSFAKFCKVKYLKLVHPKMESSFFGSLSQRSILNARGFPGTEFFTSFADMAKRVWLLHCLAFSFEPHASIFEVEKGCRFSYVYMESVNDEMFICSDQIVESESHVAFTVVPGFRIGKTVIQCQVYLSQHQTKVKKFTCS
ncbi:hypothetical protein Lal_00032781 [Lupinus albus]|uniref:Uncharacterized protein n=1 Tax=Lupinus albus TaxID=3870 RepID=A0A6A4R6P4_LUPAL|nr:hypothetical protein Lalb_Chr01g0016511 [Lupinus albus]KAF1898019.1 hypothetical protein Lal_00032781 [Lupinus albus]